MPVRALIRWRAISLPTRLTAICAVFPSGQSRPHSISMRSPRRTRGGATMRARGASLRNSRRTQPSSPSDEEGLSSTGAVAARGGLTVLLRGFGLRDLDGVLSPQPLLQLVAGEARLLDDVREQ